MRGDSCEDGRLRGGGLPVGGEDDPAHLTPPTCFTAMIVPDLTSLARKHVQYAPVPITLPLTQCFVSRYSLTFVASPSAWSACMEGGGAWMKGEGLQRRHYFRTTHAVHTN